ncbi:hypothetical protein [Naasia sp. SYSU D00057]|uniref:hypothetical protein n=1 Tax=Naasia sp. SYSU D00057 TaxID=2817380 RepID=UPI001B30B2BE|nr:hypothetical protein [Naasia sp. SYSU D00057]
MWDWTAFASGLVGAALGALACALALSGRLGRNGRRGQRLQAIENIGTEAEQLSRVREVHPPAAGKALQPETLRQMSRATAAVSELSASLQEKDAPVAAWALDRLIALVNAETPAQRFALVTVLNSNLAGWAAGRIDTAWFERENRRVASGDEPEDRAAPDRTATAPDDRP